MNVLLNRCEIAVYFTLCYIIYFVNVFKSRLLMIMIMVAITIIVILFINACAIFFIFNELQVTMHVEYEIK